MEVQNDLNSGNKPAGLPPDNYLVWAILCTVLCCLPLGIVSIIKSTEVNSKWQMGDYEGAKRSSEAAKKWAIWGAIIAVILVVLYILFFVVIGVAGGAFNELDKL